MKLLSAFAALAAAVITLGCAQGADGVASVLVVARVDVTPGSANVILGGTTQLAAAPKTASGLDVPGRTPVWSSSDAAIATVSSSGMVTGLQLGGPVRIKATVDGITGDAVITVRPVPIDHVTIEPSSVQLLTNEQRPLTGKAFDASGALLSGRSFFWESSAPNIAAVTSTGVALGITQGGPVTISATAEGKTGTATVSVATRPATRLGFVQQPGPAVAGQAMTPPVQVALQDDFLTTVVGAGNPVTIQLAGNPGGATLSGTTTVIPTNGIATFGTLSLNRVGTAYTFLVTSPGLQSATSNSFNVSVGSATQLSFTTAPPASAQSGAALGPQPVLQLQDGSGNAVPQSGVVVTASIASGPAGATLGGGTSAATNGSGQAAFTNLSITGSAGTYTLDFTAPGTGSLTSGPISLSGGAAVALAIQTQPSSAAQSGVPLTQQPAIQLRDAVGNAVSQSGIVVTAALASGSGTLGGSPTATTNSNGLAAFTSLAINGPSGSYTLRFSAPGLTGVTSGPIVLGAGAPTQLAITTQPSSSAVNGVSLAQQPVVQLRDGSNNPVALAGVEITAGVSTGGTLSGTAVLSTNASGTAAFTNLAITGLVGSYTLTFTSSGLTPATSGTITLSAGAASQLGIVTQPSAAAQSGFAFAQQPVVQLRDASGNPVSQNGTVITAALASGPGGATLGGTLTATTSSGNAGFTNLSITGPSGTYTIRFTATGLTQVTSGGVTLGAGAPTAISANSALTQSAIAGTAVAANPSVKVTDASGNPVASVAVTFAVTAGGGTVVPAGPSTVATNGSGIATATSWTLGPTAGTNNNTVTATVTGLTGSPVTFTASATVGPAAAITTNSVTTQSATVGTAVATPPSVKVTDANNNPVAGTLVTFAVTTGGGTVVPAGPSTVATNTSGIATATSWTLGTTAGTNNNSVTATATGLTGSPVTFNASGTAGAASNVAANSVTSQSAPVGTAVAAPPSVKVTDANGNPVTGFAVRFAVTAGAGTVTPASPTAVNTNTSGIATATSWILGPTAGTNNNTVTATATGLVGSPVTFTASGTAATATTIAANSATTQSATVGTAVAAPPSTKVTDTNGNPVAGVSVIFTITAGGGTLNPASPATVVTNASGVATVTSWTLGSVAGTNNNTLSAAAGGLAGSPVGFTASGVAGGGNKIAIFTQPSATAQNRVNFTQAPVIQLTDNLDNPVSTPNVSVSVLVFSGPAATLTPATALTDANGRAAFSPFSMAGVVGTRTLFFASAGYTSSPATISIVLSAGAATNLAANSAVSQSGTVGTPVSTPPSVKVTDPDGNAVSGVPVVFTVTAGGGTSSPASPATINTNTSGVATLTSWTLGPLAGANNNTVTATSSGLAGSPVTFTASGTAPLATTITANSVTTQTATVNTAVGAPPSVRVTDGSGNGVAGVSVTFALTAGGGSLSPSSPATISTDASGIATVTSWTLGGTAGTNNNTVTATATGLTGSPVTFTASGTAGTPTQISYFTQPGSPATNGLPLSPQPVLLVRDANNNNVPGAVVTAAISSAPAGSSSLIGSGAATTASNGRATFSGLGIVGPVGNYKLRFSTNAGALTSSESSTIALVAGAAAIITANSVTTQSATVSTAVSAPPSVKVTDTGGNPKGSVAVTFAVTAGGGTVVPAGPTTVSTSGSGIATATSWTLGSTAGTNNNTVTATAAGLTGSPVTFTASGTAGAPTQLTFNTQPSTTANSGAAFATQPVLLLRDAANNPVGSTVVTATITGPAGATFVGTPSATTNGSGVATFAGLGLSGPVGNYTLTFTSGAANSGASNTIALSAGAPSQLTYSTQPSTTASSGAAFAQQPVLLLRDAANNPVGSTSVTATITTSPGGGSFVGTPSATTNGSGVATFAGLGLSGPVGNYKLTFTSGAATSAASNTIALSAGAASIVTANSATSQSATVGTAVPADPSVKVTDASNNPVSGFAVTFAVTSGGGTVVPASPLTVTTNGSGIATATSWTLGPTAGTNNNTVTATAPGLTGSPVTFTASGTAGAPTQMAIAQQPSSTAASNTVFAQQPIIQVQDANGNPVSGVSVTAAIQTGTGGTLGGTATKVTDSFGNATFTDLKITGLLTYTLRFSATGPPSVDSAIITITP